MDVSETRCRNDLRNGCSERGGGAAPPQALNSLRVAVVVEQLRRKVPGGIGTYARGLLQGLASQIGVWPCPPDIALYASRLPRSHRDGETVDPLDLGLPKMLSRLPGFLLTRAWDLGFAPAPVGYSTVHSISLAAPPVRKDHRRRGRSTSVVAVHDLAWRRLPKTATRFGGWWHEAALSRAIKQASAFVVPSGATAQDLEEAGVGRDRIHVIPYGSDHLSSPDGPRTDELLSEWGVEGEFLLTVGTIEPRKNLDRLIAAYAQVRNWLPEKWPLVIVGPTGWGPSDCTKDPDGVVRLGMVDDEVLAGLYTRAHLLLYVPLLEGFGFPPLEAMRLRCPVVTSDQVPSVMEAQEEGAAIIVDPFDVDSIASGMAAGVDIDRCREGAIDRGLILASERTWQETASKHVSLWTSLH